MDDQFLKDHNVERYMIIAEKTMAPVLIIVKNSGEQIKLHVPREKCSVEEIEKFITEEISKL